MNFVDPDRTLRGLATASLGRPLEQFDTVTSTNEVALERMAAGADHGLCVIANRQTEGRGQRGRVWHSSHGVGLFMSVILRSARRVDHPTLIVAAVGLGVAEGLEFVSGLDVAIKWPNDVWIDGKKVAGVLVESRGFRPEAPALVAGIGVNVNHRGVDFPAELRDVATSLALATGGPLDRADVLRAVLEGIEPRIEQALEGGTGDLERAYRDRSVLRGREVTLFAGEEPLRGVVEDLSARDGLLLRMTGGEVRHVAAELARDVRPVDG